MEPLGRPCPALPSPEAKVTYPHPGTQRSIPTLSSRGEVKCRDTQQPLADARQRFHSTRSAGFRDSGKGIWTFASRSAPEKEAAHRYRLAQATKILRLHGASAQQQTAGRHHYGEEPA